jgi:hypothetical protein
MVVEGWPGGPARPSGPAAGALSLVRRTVLVVGLERLALAA